MAENSKNLGLDTSGRPDTMYAATQVRRHSWQTEKSGPLPANSVSTDLGSSGWGPPAQLPQEVKMDGIEYRAIAGFDAYRIGNDGSVWSQWGAGGKRRIKTNQWRQVRPYKTQKGHLRIALYRYGGGLAERFMVHRLVLEAFVGSCPGGMEACHADGNGTNNNITNLRWDTPSANWDDKRRHGRATEGTKQKQSKLTDDAVRMIRSERKAGIKLRVLAERFGVSVARISRVAIGKSWRHIHG